MLLNRNKRTETPEVPSDLKARLTQLEAAIETTRQDLAAAREDADTQNTDSILQGGHFDHGLQNKAEALSIKLASLESERRPLAAAVTQQQIKASQEAAEAELRRVEGIKARYRLELKTLVASVIEATSAHARATRVYNELPFRAANELSLPRGDMNLSPVVDAWKMAVIDQGYGDLLPADDGALMVYEATKRGDAEWNQRWLDRRAGKLDAHERRNDVQSITIKARPAASRIGEHGVEVA